MVRGRSSLKKKAVMTASKWTSASNRMRKLARAQALQHANAPSPAVSGVLGMSGALLTAAVVNHLLAVRAERKDPPRGDFITVDGVRMHYIERGTGPTLVLLHGNGATAQDFVQSGVFNLLAKDHRVIAFDRPGFGFSDRPRSRIWTPIAQGELLSKALLQLSVHRAVIVGHSWGTLVALALAKRNPSLTAGLVLLSGYYFPSIRSDVVLATGPAVPVLGDIMRYTISPFLGRVMARLVFRKMFAPAPVPANFAREFPLELAVRPSQIRASAAETALMIPGAASLAEHYRELSIPIAIMAGLGDKIVESESQSGRLAAEVPQSSLHYVPAAGHMLHHIVPEEVVAVIEDVARAALSGSRPEPVGQEARTQIPSFVKDPSHVTTGLKTS
jgi:pimeloyl-ACP methyl ester carboxylesterase